MTGRVVAVVLALAIALAGCGDEPAPPDRSPEAAARHFLDAYLEDDGRVARSDQGGDTVSEGQAYAMLLAVALRDETRFDRAWSWAERHLRGAGGLLAWRWQDGSVADEQPAADADLDAGRALVLAARAFGRPDLAADARRTADGILRSMRAGDRLVAGPWAAADVVLNPSYTAPRAFTALGPRFDALAAAGLADARALTEGPRLPPDWATAENGDPEPTGPPGSDDAASYGFDAARLPVRLAEACDEGSRAIAAALWPLLRDDSAVLPRGLDGAPAGDAEHPIALVAAAAAAHAAGDTAARDDLLDQAQELDASSPSYYGAAWVALGRVMLQSDLLGACR